MSEKVRCQENTAQVTDPADLPPEEPHGAGEAGDRPAWPKATRFHSPSGTLSHLVEMCFEFQKVKLVKKCLIVILVGF